MTPTEFLLACIADDEAAIVDDGHAIDCEDAYGVHLLPEQARRECEAKRRIVELHAAYPVPQAMVYGTVTACEECGSVDDSPVAWPCPTLRALASVYTDRPDFDPAWG
jgi:hypothetical protein